MKSKYFFEEFKDQIKDEHDKYKTFQVNTDLMTGGKCTHKGKVKMEKGVLRCPCGAGWSGTGLETLFDLLNK